MRVASLAVVISLAAAAPAFAQAPADQPAIDPAVEAQAREHFDKGRTFYNVGQYDQAITEFQQAYLLMKEPLFLFNIAQSYRLKGDCDSALRFYKNYLREQPEPPILEEVEAAVQKCEDKKAQTPPTPPPTERPKRGKGLRIAGLSTMAAGVLLAGMGVYFGVQAKSDADAVSDYTGPWGPEQEDLEARGQRNEMLFFVLTGTGAAAIIGGGVLYYLGLRQLKESPAVAIIPAAGGFHVSWALAF
jgi:tetratricopeptide (TPR) repeat protein